MIGKSALIACAGLLIAGPALADCKDELRDLHKGISEFKSQTMFGSEIRKIRAAAVSFNRLGNPDACEDTVKRALEVIETRKDKIEERREAMREKRRYMAAMPVNTLPGVVITSSLQGVEVYNTEAKELGVIEEVAIDADTGDLGYLVLTHGGILGISEKHTPVPWSQFRITDDRDELVLNISSERLEKAPSYDWDNRPVELDKGWRDKVAKFFDKELISGNCALDRG